VRIGQSSENETDNIDQRRIVAKPMAENSIEQEVASSSITDAWEFHVSISEHHNLNAPCSNIILVSIELSSARSHHGFLPAGACHMVQCWFPRCEEARCFSHSMKSLVISIIFPPETFPGTCRLQDHLPC
jgi:hypothetical protein